MAYTTKQKNDVKDIIETYTNDYLDRYCQADVIKQASDAMEANKSKTSVANTVFDYIHEKYEGDNIVYATALQQCMPKDIMLILRQEIISILT